MRCSKCGYISFDHLESCPKCHKPMAQTQLKGTAYSVAPPLFFQPGQAGDVEELASGDGIVDVLDPDLDLLAVDVDEGIAFEDMGEPDQEIVMQEDIPSLPGDEISPGADFEKAFAAQASTSGPETGEEDLLVDTSRFEGSQADLHPEPAKKGADFLEMPEELADISDLAPPAAERVSPSSGATAGKDDLDLDFAKDLDLADLELSFDEKEMTTSTPSGKDEDLISLSLDDIDLSGGTGSAPPQSSPLSLDDELNFDFDLEGIGEKKIDEKKDQEKKKPTEDFPDFTLSLD